MKTSNTAILLILRDHLVPYQIKDGVVMVQAKDCAKPVPESRAWIKVPDIVSAMWVVGKLHD